MEFLDSHCHLEKAVRNGTVNEVLERAHANDVRTLIAVGTSLEDWEIYRELSERHPTSIHWTVGIHPCSVTDGWSEDMKAIPTYFATSPAPVALGEIGLDFFHLPKYPDEVAEVKRQQMEAFRAQLQLAYQFDCPVVIHSRNAFSECVRMIDESGVNWENVVFHCFTEGADSIEVLNRRGGRASFTGIVTYKGASANPIREAALAQGLDRLMIETDAPYLTPEPNRGKINEPARVRDVGDYLARLLGIEAQALAEATTANARAFFRLPG